jgi:hypothetical protein
VNPKRTIGIVFVEMFTTNHPKEEKGFLESRNPKNVVEKLV